MSTTETLPHEIEPLTLERFNREVCEFRSVMCDKRFWTEKGEPNAILDKMFSTLASCYLKTKDDTGAAATTFQALASEFTRRQTMMLDLRLDRVLSKLRSR